MPPAVRAARGRFFLWKQLSNRLHPMEISNRRGPALVPWALAFELGGELEKECLTVGRAQELGPEGKAVGSETSGNVEAGPAEDVPWPGVGAGGNDLFVGLPTAEAIAGAY